jgi:hypothetical protein
MIAPGSWSRPASPGNAFAAIRTTAATIVSSRVRNQIHPRSQRSEGDGASAFATDPAGSSQDQAIFWAPEVLPTIIPIVRSTPAFNGNVLSLTEMSAGEIRQAADGWHVLLRVRSVEHRLWLRERPAADAAYAAELPFDNDFEIRAHAAHRLWRSLNGRPAGPVLHELSPQRRQRLALALRALDARAEGNSYRIIAEGLFGAKHIPEQGWKTHDLRNRTIRLVQTGFALMRGGYCELLRQARRKK